MATSVLRTNQFSNHPDLALRMIEEEIDLLLEDLSKKQWTVTVMSEHLTKGDRKFINLLADDIFATSNRIKEKVNELGNIAWDMGLKGEL